MPHPAQLHPDVPLPPEVRALLHRDGALRREVHADAAIAAFTQGQDGVVARRQLLAVGLARRVVDRRVAGGLLVARFHGVYALGDLHLTLDGHRTAAVLAVRGGRLSHGDCCALHGVGGGGGAFWDLTVPGHGGRRRRGRLRVHATTTFRPRDLAVVGGLPCTSLPRAIADAAQVLDRRRMANVLAETERRGLLHLAALREVMERVKHRPTRAHALLVHVLTEHLRHGAQLTRSEVEEALREIAERAGLPAPLMNRVIGGAELDAWWPDVGLGIEVDSWEFHDHRRAFVADRAKLRHLFLRGVLVLPYAAADLVHRPDLVAAELAALRRQAATMRRTAA